MSMKPMKPLTINKPTMENNKMNKTNNELPHGIKTPESVKEFRKNLGKYFWTDGGMGKKLYVQLPNGGSQFIDISKISSFSDIYEITKTGFSSGGSGGSPCVSPKIDMEKDVSEFMSETKQFNSFYGYFDNEKNYNFISNQYDVKNPKWVSLDNQIYREFFSLTLGEYCGYVMVKKEVV